MHTDDRTNDSTSRVRARAPRQRLIAVASRRPPGRRFLDPTCGPGGIFASSARFVAEHKENPTAELSVQCSENRIERTLSANIRFSSLLNNSFSAKLSCKKPNEFAG
jgi:hypothetical protein